MKFDFKVILFTAFIAVAVTCSIYFFNGLRAEKDASRIDVLSLLPSDSKTILKINSFGEFTILFSKNIRIDASNEGYFNWLIVLNHLINPFMKETNSFFEKGRSPVFVSYHAIGELYFIKIQPGEVNAWENQLCKDTFSPFPPAVQHYDGFEIRHYILKNDKFFSCIFTNGVFVASFNPKLLYQAINDWNNDVSIKDNINFNRILKTSGDKTVASLYRYIHANENFLVKDIAAQNSLKYSGWSNSDITFSGSKIWFSGYFSPDNSDVDLLLDKENVMLSFPERFFVPDALLMKGMSLKENANSASYSKDRLFSNHTSNELYNLYTDNQVNNQVNQLYGLKINYQHEFQGDLSSYLRHNYRNRFWEKNVNIDGNTFIYTVLAKGTFLNELVNDNLFNEDEPHWITIHDDLLLIAHSENELTAFLQQTAQKYSSGKTLFKNDLNTQCNMIFLGDLNKIIKTTDYSPIQPASYMLGHSDFFSQWQVSAQLAKERDLLFYHFIFFKDEIM